MTRSPWKRAFQKMDITKQIFMPAPYRAVKKSSLGTPSKITFYAEAQILYAHSAFSDLITTQLYKLKINEEFQGWLEHCMQKDILSSFIFYSSCFNKFLLFSKQSFRKQHSFCYSAVIISKGKYLHFSRSMHTKTLKNTSRNEALSNT